MRQMCEILTGRREYQQGHHGRLRQDHHLFLHQTPPTAMITPPSTKPTAIIASASPSPSTIAASSASPSRILKV